MFIALLSSLHMEAALRKHRFFTTLGYSNGLKCRYDKVRFTPVRLRRATASELLVRKTARPRQRGCVGVKFIKKLPVLSNNLNPNV
jgi:hypothetical protein